jgi:hypothetical protein
LGNFGGGIFNDGGTVTVTNSTLSGNTSGCGFGGGGIFNNGNGGTVTVTNSTFSGNIASVNAGGGIFNNGGPVTVTNSTFSGNTSATGGGGIFNQGGPVTVTNSTFSGNTATGGVGGGAIYNNGATVRLTNTIVANSPSGGNCRGSAVTDGGHNLDDGTTCGFSAANHSLSGTPAQLDPAGLANHGGPTQTIALCTGTGTPASCTGASPAIDGGDDAVTGPPDNLTTDQRGRPRRAGAHVDIGAFEVQPPAGVPAVSSVGLIGLILLLSAVGGLALRRRAPA